MTEYKAFTKTFFLWIFSLFLLTAVPEAAHSRIYVDITSPYFQKIPIAVPYAKTSPGTFENDLLGRKISDILSNDLKFHGFFSVLEPERYGGRADADWSKFRMNYVVRGTLWRSGKSVIAELKLIDLANGSVIEGRRYKGDIKALRAMAHRFSNLIVEAITGESGVSLSKLTFVAQKNRIREVYSSDFDGFNVKRETFDMGITLSPRYSPDGRYVVYTSFRTGKPCLYIKDIKTGEIHRLTAFSGLNIAPAWHPDSKRLAVTLSKDGNPDIYVVDLNGKIQAKLTNGPGINVSPTWSPNGKRLAFVSDRTGSPQIYVMDLQDGSVRRITYRGSYNTDPQWSPRGDRIAYSGRIDGQFQVFTVAPEGGDPVQLTFKGSNENPSWSPDGRQIMYSSTRLGRYKALFVMFANGTGQRMLLHFAKGVTTPHWGPNRF
ncbi:MAG TPA: Tol-Pal system beta propeller repeat protein TolB [Thermodesulfobacteriaceae bacterium]|nr:Tol-Pal system beta propeller repeat protein TolB [Thermodesulfobacteriaceae bacterium]